MGGYRFLRKTICPKSKTGKKAEPVYVERKVKRADEGERRREKHKEVRVEDNAQASRLTTNPLYDRKVNDAQGIGINDPNNIVDDDYLATGARDFDDDGGSDHKQNAMELP